MKFRVGACALLVCLAGCSADAPGTKFGEQRGAASATSRTAQRLPSVQAGRGTAQSVANAPDRGELISYKNKGAAIKREGAYTWYPVAISEAHALKAVVDGVMSIPSPDGSQVKVRYERHVESPDGNWTWIGRVIGGDQKQEAILTFGEKAVYGSIPQKTGAPLSLQTRGGQLYAVQTDLSKVKNPNSRTDMMVPPAQALRSSLMAQVSKAQVSQSAIETKAATPASTVDVAIGYTAGFATTQGGQSAAVTRLVFLVEVGNQAFENSLINGAIRVVNALQVNYTDTTTNKAALAELTGRNENNGVVTVPASLVPLRDAREQYGADLVILVRKFQTPENEGCGIAWLNGSGQLPIDPALDDDYGFGVVSDGNDTGTDGNSYFCAPESLIHEIGHLMGSAHDRDNSKKTDGSQLFGRYPYSFGMKTTAANGNFYTIMAYGDNNQNFYRTFSNPLVLKCGPAGNLACGVADTTDNARSLNQTIPVVAQFRASVVPFDGDARNDINGDGRSDIFWRNDSSGQLESWIMNAATLTKATGFNLPAGYRAMTSGDFNGDGNTDLLLTNAARELVMWFSTGTSFNGQSLNRTYGAGWVASGNLDVDGDGKSDLLWKNQSGQVETWTMNGATLTKATGFTLPVGYRVMTTGDFNGDGNSDLLLNNASRQLIMWFSTGSTFNGQALGNVYGDGWLALGQTDVNGDGKSDLIWRNDTNGQIETWIMNGATLTTARGFTLPAGYKIYSYGDFNGDSFADLLLTNGSRDLVMWFGTGSTFNGQALNRVYGVGWAADLDISSSSTNKIRYDINADGKSDLLWRGGTGQIESWVMNGATLTKATGFNLPAGYQTMASGDFNGDGFEDLLLSNASRQLVMWFSTGTSYNGQSLNRVYGAGWTVSGNVDFNSDGTSDLLWRNDANGQIETWVMNGATLVKATGFTLPAGYRVFTTGDFNGDSNSDLLLTNGARELAMWFGTGTTFNGQSLGRIYGAGWSAVGTFDANGDGVSDLLWRNDANGQIETWNMNGATLVKATGFTLPAGYLIYGTGDYNGDGFSDLLLSGPSRELVMWFGTGTTFNGQALGRVYGAGWTVLSSL